MPFEVLDDREGDELKRGYALEHLQEQLREWEGSEEYVYLDINDIPHIGMGFALKVNKENIIKRRIDELSVRSPEMNTKLLNDEAEQYYKSLVKDGAGLLKYKKGLKSQGLNSREVYKQMNSERNRRIDSGEMSHFSLDLSEKITDDLMVYHMGAVEKLYENVDLNYLQLGVLADLHYQSPSYIKKGTSFYKNLHKAVPDWPNAIYEISERSNKENSLGIQRRQNSRVADLDISIGGDGSGKYKEPLIYPHPSNRPGR